MKTESTGFLFQDRTPNWSFDLGSNTDANPPRRAAFPARLIHYSPCGSLSHRHGGELPYGLFFLPVGNVYTECMDPNEPSSTNPFSPSSGKETPSQAGSKLLSKYSDTDGLLVRNSSAAKPEPQAKAPAIPLQRFQELEQAIRHSPANPEPYVELGQIYLQQERWSDAKRALDAGFQYCPECEPIVLMREDLVLHLAGQHVDEARRRHAQQPSEETKYALEQADINLANERIRVCNDRYHRRPDQKEILITWAVALRQLGRHDEALSKLSDAAQEPSLRARASLQLGMCLQTLDRPLDALAAFRKAALYRSPPPDLAVRNRALELAMHVADENGLIDSARYYAERLHESCDSSQRESVAREMYRLREKDL
jgi:tetratricopeptide (TPR) repeat protein